MMRMVFIFLFNIFLGYPSLHPFLKLSTPTGIVSFFRVHMAILFDTLISSTYTLANYLFFM